MGSWAVSNFQQIAKLAVFQNAESVNLIGFFPTVDLMIMRKEEVKAGLPAKIATLTNVDLLGNNNYLITRDNWANNPMYSRHFFEWEFDDIDPMNKENLIIKGSAMDINLKEEIRSANLFLPHLRSVVPAQKKEIGLTL
jgi:hypothetical protein